MRINNGIFVNNIVEYKGKKYTVVGVGDNKCELRINDTILKNIDVLECTKIE